MSNQLILYDLPCKSQGGCWSPNVWKTRLVLNYKNIPYRTEYLSHPEIEPKLKSHGLEPNAPGQGSPYTLPAIQLPDGTSIMESSAIASKLESLCPSPSLHLDNGLPAKVGPIIGKAVGPLVPVFMPRIGRDRIVDSCYDWFQEARAQKFGMPLDELEKAKGGEQAWEASRPGLQDLKAFLKECKKDEGPFVQGSEVCYADFLVCSMVEALRKIGPDLFEKAMEVYDGDDLRKLHEACTQWMKDDK